MSQAQQLTLANNHADGEEREDRGAVLVKLLGLLADQDYRHVTTTPLSHAAVLAQRDQPLASNIRDVFGWNLPFEPDALPRELFDLGQRAGVLVKRVDGSFVSRCRVASVGELLFLHGAYPTDAEDSVFLGPDSYRFANFIQEHIGRLGQGARILDYAAGAGVGGIVAARSQPGSDLTLADVNAKALDLARVNAAFAGIEAHTVQVASPREMEGAFDLIVMHPPFMIDPAGRAYRDGGDLHGAQLSLDWMLAASEKLKIGGRLMMHTGVAIVDGRDVLEERLAQALKPPRYALMYRELDPDIFGNELSTPSYASVERISAVGALVTRVI